MHISTRASTSTDEEFLFKVYQSTRADEVNSWGWSTEQIYHFLCMQFNMQRQSYNLQYPDLETKIITHEKCDIGVLRTWEAAEEIVVVDIALLPKHRNQGIGTYLMKEIQRVGSEQNKSIRLSVFHQNVAAQRLYKSLGFVFTSLNGMYYSMIWTQ